MSETKKIPSLSLITDIAIILIVLVSRLFSMSRFLHKWDSVQFALGMHNYNIAGHQPHPPGYPAYVGLGWIFNQFLQDDNTALVTVGILSSVILSVAVHHIGKKLIGPRGGIIAGVLSAFNPLLWYFSSIALAYISGAAVSTVSVWIALKVSRKYKWLIPVVAGISSAFWLPAGILTFPLCVWLYARNESDEKLPYYLIRIFSYSFLFLMSMMIFYTPVIILTGGIGQFLATIGSESGKHVLRFSEWSNNPVGEFVATTGSIADFLARGVGMGKWLLLFLLIPVTTEKGAPIKRVIMLFPLGVGGFLAMHFGNTIFLTTIGIFAFLFVSFQFIPTPRTGEGKFRQWLFGLWVIPGFLLFTAIYVNYIGIFTIFLPAFMLLTGWGIERFAEFMKLQSISEDGEKENNEPDKRVEPFVALIMTGLMVMSYYGTFTHPASTEQESLNGIIARDLYIESVLNTIHMQDLDISGTVILGGEDDYRHWTYYFPSEYCIWTKYLLDYSPVEGRGIRTSQNHQQTFLYPQLLKDENTGIEWALIDISEYDTLICFNDDYARLGETERRSAIPIYVSSETEDIEPVCFIINIDNDFAEFTKGMWKLEAKN